MMKIRAKPSILKKIHRSKDQLQLQTYRGSGKGGQNRNKRDTACRIVDLVTGITATAEEYRTQEQNRKAAMERLVKRLIQHYEDEEKSLEDRRNRSPDREVRVYKEKHNLVVCGLTGKKYSYKAVLDGELSEAIKNLITLEEGVDKC